MEVGLVSMPWSSASRPSAAVGALTAFLRQRFGDWTVTPAYQYVDVAADLGLDLYRDVSEHCYELGEVINLGALNPHRRDRVLDYVESRLGSVRMARSYSTSRKYDAGADAERLVDAISAHAEAAADALASCDVVGMTTCFGQLFGNVLLARLLKQRNPRIRTVLGGSTVSSRVGPSVLREYPEIDFVVQGEGEVAFADLLAAMAAGASTEGLGVASRDRSGAITPVQMREIPSLDELPVPEYAEYAEKAATLGLGWSIPIEGSRGCWWDRASRTGRPEQTCYFCNLNVQWKRYREKSSDRICAEVEELTSRFKTNRVFFLDNIIRHTGVEELAEGLVKVNRSLHIFYEMRASIRPGQILVLAEAGVSQVQFGIEALSSTLLKRINKGTRVIQNLEVMKTCYELDIDNKSNLIVGFPGSTETEVQETVRMIDEVALCWQPLEITEFALGMGSSVEVLQDRFGITKVRNRDYYKTGLPEETWSRLELLDLDFEFVEDQADWQPVRDARARWLAQHERGSRRRAECLLEYEDGRDFLRIRDRRGAPRDHILTGMGRRFYLYASEIRTLEELYEAMGARTDDARAHLDRFIEDLRRKALVFTEGQKVLSLAIARNARLAAARIRELAQAGRIT